MSFSGRRTLAILAFCQFTSVSFAATMFVQTNLVSDITGLAANTDASLKNPWGISFNPTSPFWVSDQVTGLSTLYNASGVKQALVVTIPGGSPTGQVFNNTTGFLLNGTASTFIFSTLTGNIEAWNGGSTATIEHTTTVAAYTGLALANNQLFAANKATGKIDIFDNAFNPVTLPGTPFTVASGGLTPYNVQAINGNLWVEYSGARGAPGGLVAEFDTAGNLLLTINDSHLNAPWGVALAPSGFGTFGNDLLVGNFNDGMINAFNPSTGAFIGTLTDTNGAPIANPGLWALEFRDTSVPNANTGNNPNTLFISAGINNEADGLFAAVNPTPEPGTWVLMALAGCGFILYRKFGLKS